MSSGGSGVTEKRLHGLARLTIEAPVGAIDAALIGAAAMIREYALSPHLVDITMEFWGTPRVHLYIVDGDVDWHETIKHVDHAGRLLNDANDEHHPPMRRATRSLDKC